MSEILVPETGSVSQSVEVPVRKGISGSVDHVRLGVTSASSPWWWPSACSPS